MLHRLVHYTEREDMTSMKFTALADGPYRLQGQVAIFDRQAQPIPDRGARLPVPLRAIGRQAVL